jgi:hypothetical protein
MKWALIAFTVLRGEGQYDMVIMVSDEPPKTDGSKAQKEEFTEAKKIVHDQIKSEAVHVPKEEEADHHDVPLLSAHHDSDVSITPPSTPGLTGITTNNCRILN